jgi:hypothetical protein
LSEVDTCLKKIELIEQSMNKLSIDHQATLSQNLNSESPNNAGLRTEM